MTLERKIMVNGLLRDSPWKSLNIAIWSTYHYDRIERTLPKILKYTTCIRPTILIDGVCITDIHNLSTNPTCWLYSLNLHDVIVIVRGHGKIYCFDPEDATELKLRYG